MPTNKVAKDDTLQSLVSAVEDIAELMGDGVINDSSTAADKTWSASKENTTVNGLKSNIIANTKLIKDTVGWSGKNILENLLESHTTNGVTMTHNADDSITLNNTATAWTFQNINYKGADVVSIPTGDYIISGGNSKVTFKIMVNGSSIFAKKVTQDEPFTIPANITSSYMRIEFDNGTVFNNDTIYPMIRPANILDPTFEPYFGSTAFPRSEQAVLGAENLCPFFKSEVDNGITFTVDSDGVVDVDGEATFTSVDNILEFFLRKGTYTLSGVPSGYGNNKLILLLTDTNNTEITRDRGEGTTFTLSDDTMVRVKIYVYQSYGDYDHVKVHPMINIGAAAMPYVPYAMTNRLLTERVAISGTIPYTAEDIDISHTESTTTITPDAPRTFILKLGKLRILSFYISGVSTSAGGSWKELFRTSALPSMDGKSGNAYEIIGIGCIYPDAKSIPIKIIKSGIVSFLSPDALSNKTIGGCLIYIAS